MRFRQKISFSPNWTPELGKKYIARFTHPDFPHLKGIYKIKKILYKAENSYGHNYEGYYWCEAIRIGRVGLNLSGQYSLHPKGFIREIE